MIRPCSREACNEIFLSELESKEIPFVKVCVGDRYFAYCCPRCASIDINPGAAMTCFVTWGGAYHVCEHLQLRDR